MTEEPEPGHDMIPSHVCPAEFCSFGIEAQGELGSCSEPVTTLICLSADSNHLRPRIPTGSTHPDQH